MRPMMTGGTVAARSGAAPVPRWAAGAAGLAGAEHPKTKTSKISPHQRMQLKRVPGGRGYRPRPAQRHRNEMLEDVAMLGTGAVESRPVG